MSYSSRHGSGVVEAAPKFYDFPEMWPIRNTITSQSYSRKIELVLSLEVLGYFKEKRVRNDKVYFTTQPVDKEGASRGIIQEGFVVKNDPFKKEMMVTPEVVPIVDGVFLDDKLEGMSVTKISYFQLRAGKTENSRVRKMEKYSESDGDDESDDEEDCNIRTELPKAKKVCNRSFFTNTFYFFLHISISRLPEYDYQKFIRSVSLRICLFFMEHNTMYVYMCLVFSVYTKENGGSEI